MPDRRLTMLPSPVDNPTRTSSVSHGYQFFDAHDQQTFAASNTLCDLNHSQQPAVFQSETPSHQNNAGFYGHSSFGTDQNLAWSGRQAWMEPCFGSTPPYQAALWDFGPPSTSTNSIPCTQYPILPSCTGQQHDIPVIAPYSMDDQWPMPMSTGHQTPPLESFPDDFFHTFAPSPPTEPAWRYYAGRATTSDYEDIDDATAMTGHNSRLEKKLGGIPYAKLIYQALMEAKGNSLVLKDIYKWIEDYTDKAKDPSFKGWQNSVRHNLSMNGVRMRIECYVMTGDAECFRPSPKPLVRLPQTISARATYGSSSLQQ